MVRVLADKGPKKRDKAQLRLRFFHELKYRPEPIIRFPQKQSL
jgi:hypothetical protein